VSRAGPMSVGKTFVLRSLSDTSASLLFGNRLSEYLGAVLDAAPVRHRDNSLGFRGGRAGKCAVARNTGWWLWASWSYLAERLTV
jgi:hypothetical protein